MDFWYCTPRFLWLLGFSDTEMDFFSLVRFCCAAIWVMDAVFMLPIFLMVVGSFTREIYFLKSGEKFRASRWTFRQTFNRFLGFDLCVRILNLSREATLLRLKLILYMFLEYFFYHVKIVCFLFFQKFIFATIKFLQIFYYRNRH